MQIALANKKQNASDIIIKGSKPQLIIIVSANCRASSEAVERKL